MKRKVDFINDKRRISYLRAIYNRIYRGNSVLIEGNYGAGKTKFLELITPKKRKRICLESLDNIHEILASILRQLDYEAIPTYRRTSKHLKMIKELSGFVIIIDEASDLDKRVWPYFKRIIDARIPIIFTGLPKVRTFLLNEHPDIVSRLKILTLYPIIVEDFIMEYNDFEPEAIEQIYSKTSGDMRKFSEVCEDCRDKAKELELDMIELEMALSFLSELDLD
ncbi:ATP-binding protein [Desulfobacterales bacterium HSG17]|nr:ATP-binding protein [Desulfobacterales bacterium HSG17]